jgi:hypothetical protein
MDFLLHRVACGSAERVHMCLTVVCSGTITVTYIDEDVIGWNAVIITLSSAAFCGINTTFNNNSFPAGSAPTPTYANNAITINVPSIGKASTGDIWQASFNAVSATGWTWLPLCNTVSSSTGVQSATQQRELLHLFRAAPCSSDSTCDSIWLLGWLLQLQGLWPFVRILAFGGYQHSLLLAAA